MANRMKLVLTALMLTGIVTINGLSAAENLAVRPPAAPAPGATFPIDHRVPWTTSRVVGTPEAPPPFRTVNAYPHIKLTGPDDIGVAPGLDRIFVVEQGGKVWSFPNDPQCPRPDLLVDLRTSLRNLKEPDVKGFDSAFGITFHPRFQENHFVYICYVMAQDDEGRKHNNGTRVSRFTMTKLNPPALDMNSEVVLIDWRGGGHNAGCIKFGPDGMLYISAGDSADPSPPDPLNTGQDISDLLSSIMRIDVDHEEAGKHYAIPKDNPFISTPGARPEVWAYGLRNPWRMNFDRQTGNLWVGDVGWELWESIDCAKAGGNYGWSIMEGPNAVHPNGKRGPTPILPPALSYSHTEGASLSGGTVYRGAKFPELFGCYIFGDWMVDRIWAARCTGEKLDQLEPHHLIAETGQKVVAFGELPDGELLIVDHGGGGIWRLERNPAANESKSFPHHLSETGLFSSTAEQTPVAGVMPFAINAPQWVDGAASEHWVAVPGDDPVTWGKDAFGGDDPLWPKNSVLVRTLSLPAGKSDSVAAPAKKVETQLLHFDGAAWRGYTYAWNDEQTDAELVPAGGATRIVSIPDDGAPGGTRKQRWQFNSRSQCITCHNSWCSYRLAFNVPQLDRKQNYGAVSENQVRVFKTLGLLLEPKPADPSVRPERAAKVALANPYDNSADLSERARSYFHANCSHCHRAGAGGSALFDVRKELPIDKTKMVDVRPNLGDFGIADARLICPGEPSKSVILYRMAKLGRERMPHIGSEMVDDQGLELIRQWIVSLNTGKQSVAQSEALRKVGGTGATSASAGPEIDKLLGSTEGALALICAIDSGAVIGPVKELATQRGLAAPQELVRDLFRRFDPNESSADRLGANVVPASILGLAGDPARGRHIFFEQSGGLCAKCHRVEATGNDFGPDLTHIATKYKPADLLDNILNPSKTIAPGFASYLVKTRDGEVLSGLLVSKTDQQIVLKDASLKTVTIPATRVQKVVEQKVSAMPEGLLADLSAQQAADLLAYLSERK